MGIGCFLSQQSDGSKTWAKVDPIALNGGNSWTSDPLTPHSCRQSHFHRYI